MKLPDLKSTVVAMGIGAALMYLYMQYKNMSVVISDTTTALLVGAGIGGAVQIIVRLIGVS